MAIDTGEHVVHFYERDSELAELVTRYLEPALEADEVGLVIATQSHRAAFGSELTRAGVDVPGAIDAGALVMLDAEATMQQFIPGGRIDPEAFRTVIGGAVQAAGAGGRTIRAYGEMVALLWDAGNVPQAIELESLWNELAEDFDFSLLCAYHSASVSGSEHSDALHDVCRLHTSVLHAPPRGSPGSPTAGGVLASCELPAAPTSPSAARRFVVDALQPWELGGELLDDARLLISELATNAVVHARTPFSVAVRSDGSRVRLSVRDGCTRNPRVALPGHRAPSGRGLRLVAALASNRWGVQTDSAGKTIWAELGA